MRLPIKGYYFTIDLTQNQQAIVDEKDWYRLNSHKWHACWCPNTKSYIARRNIRLLNGNKTLISMHREIFDLIPVEDKDIHVDHMNHNTLDNRRENLELVSNWKNHQNINRSSPHGIGIERMSGNRRKPFRARVQIENKDTTIGTFSTVEEAQEARKEYLNDLDEE